MSFCKAEPPFISHFYGSFFTLKSKLIGLEKGNFCLVKIQGILLREESLCYRLILSIYCVSLNNNYFLYYHN